MRPLLVLALLGVPSVGLACEPLVEVPEKLSVAWVSKVPAGASDNTWLQVVQLPALRDFITRSNRDTQTVLRGLGLLGRTQVARSPYKVTVFEVPKTVLCRPMDGEPGTDVSGIPVCDTSEQKAGVSTKAASYSGCGYLTDLGAGVRGLDVYRVRWADAVRQGFCVLPWERMLAEG